jgi:cyclopropane-fatty-acyl-phospholipid synthase
MPGTRPATTPAAPLIAEMYQALAGTGLPIGLEAWDGSRAGPQEPPTLVVNSPRALRRLLWAPNELGLAQAYVTGDIDVDGDMNEGLRRAWASVALGAHRPRVHTLTTAARVLIGAARLGAIGTRPAAPTSQARMRGRVHTKARDRAVIAHHYDLSNEFYALLLDPTMAYSSAYWTCADPDYTLEDAQRDKLDLICRKLDLSPGTRLLDVGCGWGGLLIHAAQHYGVEATGLTLSREQAAYIRARVDELGLSDRVTVRFQHFRELAETGRYSAIASIEMGEHVGADAYPAYTRALHTALEPGGRLLIQQMSRAPGAAPGGGRFIESFIAPDMHMRPLAETAGLWRAAGFELLDTESLREHYVHTVQAWQQNLEAHWTKAVGLVGPETARVWRLYLAGGALAFEQGRMGVDQILAIKPGAVRPTVAYEGRQHVGH